MILGIKGFFIKFLRDNNCNHCVFCYKSLLLVRQITRYLKLLHNHPCTYKIAPFFRKKEREKEYVIRVRTQLYLAFSFSIEQIHLSFNLNQFCIEFRCLHFIKVYQNLFDKLNQCQRTTFSFEILFILSIVFNLKRTQNSLLTSI